MAIAFGISSNNFSLYEAFKKEAEKVGWVYNEAFNPFLQGRMDCCNCMYFDTAWGHEGINTMFSFSNTSEPFNLPQQWDQAIEHMKNVYNKTMPQPESNSVVKVSLKALAEQHGVDVEDIVITA